MPDASLRYIEGLPRQQLRDTLRRAGTFEPNLRILAEDILGADTSIDFIAVDPEGRVVLVLIGEEGEDRGLLTQALAERAFVRPRLRDWLQLAPNLGVSATAPVVVHLLCPAFSPETRSAAQDLGPDVVDLFSLRCVRNGSEATVLLEPLAPASLPAGRQPAVKTTSERLPRFRSGLSADDLGLTQQEIREFQ